MKFTAGLALLCVVGFSHLSIGEGASPVRTSAKAIVEATFREVHFGKPPLKFLRFDVTLHNPSSNPRWLILPATLPYQGDTVPAPGGVETELQVFLLSKHPRVLLLYGVAGNFQAVLLPGQGWVTLRNLPIEAWWQEVPAKTDLEVIVARSVTIGGAALGDLIGALANSESGAAVDAQSNAGDERSLQFWHPKEGSFPPIAIDVESRAKISVPIPKR